MVEKQAGRSPWLPERNMCAVLWLVAQSCLTLCDPMGCSPPGSSVHGDSTGQNTGVGCHALLQGIFSTQGWNPGLPHCRQILYHWTTREAQETGVGSLSVLQGTFRTQGTNWGLLPCRWILYCLSHQGSPQTVYQLLTYNWHGTWCPLFTITLGS